jgi:hypothetical protein
VDGCAVPPGLEKLKLAELPAGFHIVIAAFLGSDKLLHSPVW